MTATCTRCERGHNLPKRGTIAPERCPRCLAFAVDHNDRELKRLRAIEARLNDFIDMCDESAARMRGAGNAEGAKLPADLAKLFKGVRDGDG